jgi:hypothetical protein
MMKHRESRRPTAREDRGGGPPSASGRKLALSGFVHRAVVTFGEQGHQRRTLINILLLAQALLMLASVPGYVGQQREVPALVAAGLGLVACLVAWVLNQLFRDTRRAAYALVFGGTGAILAQVLVGAIAGDALHTSLSSLLLLTAILDASLLFSPEVTLIIAASAVAVGTIALLLALSLGPTLSRDQVYALVEGTIGPLCVTGLIAWLLSQFVYDSAVEAQRARELQFAQARLDALVAQTADQRKRLHQAIASIQQAIGDATNGRFATRVNIVDGELGPVAASLNRLLDQLQAVSPTVAASHQMESGALGWTGVAGSAEDGPTSPPANLYVPASSPVDAGSPVAGQVTASAVRRLARVQELAGEIVGALAHSQDGLSTTAQATAEALRTVGAALAAADGMLTVSQRGADLAARIRRSVSAVLPGQVSNRLEGDANAQDTAGQASTHASALSGLGPDLGVGAPGTTGAFNIIGLAGGASGADVAAAAATTGAESAMRVSAHSKDPGPSEAATQRDGDDMEAPATEGKRRRGGSSRGETKLPAPQLVEELVEMLDQLYDEVVRQERTASTMTHELGLVNRNVRGVDIGVAWARQALEAVRRNAERLHQTAGGSAPAPVAGDVGPNSQPLPVGLPARVPTATRPLAEVSRLSLGALPPDSGVDVPLQPKDPGSRPTLRAAVDSPSAISGNASGTGEAGKSTPDAAAQAIPGAGDSDDSATNPMKASGRTDVEAP